MTTIHDSQDTTPHTAYFCEVLAIASNPALSILVDAQVGSSIRIDQFPGQVEYL